MTHQFPLHTTLEPAALPTAGPRARLHAKVVLMESGLVALGETVELLVSELVWCEVR